MQATYDKTTEEVVLRLSAQEAIALADALLQADRADNVYTRPWLSRTSSDIQREAKKSMLL